jgi:hypothetical protein
MITPNIKIGLFPSLGIMRIYDQATYATPELYLANFKVTSPLAVVHNNTSWATPDIDPDNISGTGTYLDIAMPLDSFNHFLAGTYIIEQTTKEYNGIAAVLNYTITSVDQGIKTFYVTGDAHTISGTHVITGSTGNDGGYSVVSAIYNAGTGKTAIVVNESIPDATGDGQWWSNTQLDYTYTWDGTGGTTVSATLKITDALNFTEPVVTMTLAVNCTTSQLDATDITDYRITDYSGIAIDKTSDSRTTTFQYPRTLQTLLPDVVRTSALVTEVLTPIYTKTNKVTITNAVVYALSTYTTLNLTVTGVDEINVQCSVCSCLLYDCEVALVNAWLASRASNPTIAAEYDEKIKEFYIYKSLWQSAITCGKTADITTYCNLAKGVLSTLCDCSTNTLAYSTLVIPVTGLVQTVGGTGSHIYFGATGVNPPSNSIGNDGDTYYNTTGTLVPVYYKVGGVWTLQFTAKGATGAASTVAGAPGTNGTTILHNEVDYNGTSAGMLLEQLDDYKILGGTLTSIGDAIRQHAVFYLAQNDNTKTIAWYLDGTLLFSFDVTDLISVVNQDLVVDLNMDVYDTDKVFFDWTVTQKGGLNGSIIASTPKFFRVDLASSFASDHNITIYAQNSVASANEIVLVKNRIELLKI